MYSNTYTHTYRAQSEAPVIRVSWPETNMAHKGIVKGGVPSSKS